ncbi:YheC/YheD family protein [Bacillus sp. FJAT-29790]|uniref:YheC/YheD family protein n=1 Tax=Bacillus sp. FJAT-29790 TaxID=1895002 RepID=UPI001C21B482|nr:YheC/YheD family protein [Bacillus sp. FJAT-29790]MBU8879980.1 YheC/YheD family protein [Bacillus sp. FJAT-29790]
MSDSLGKWKQSLLLRQSPLTANSIPETDIYSLKNLIDLMNRHDYVYVKHDTSGQGRAMFKIFKRNDGHYCFNGFTFQGKLINKCVTAIEDFHQLLHPFEKFGRLTNYIIQEGIPSLTLNRLPFSIRSHVQNLEGQWVIGGMFGKIGSDEAIDHGIANTHQGAQVVPMDKLLSVHLKMDDAKKDEVIDSLQKVSISAAEVIASQFPCREYGIDLGLHRNGEPVIFEVNTTPGIGGFARIENKALWERIVEIRKLQKELNLKDSFL